jgi:sugar phosphate isomerase/epimerase
MKLGFVSAILPDLSLEQVVDFAADNGFSCLEPMCWPMGKAERRYAGITHVDVAKLGQGDVEGIKELLESRNIEFSALGYYPNPLAPDAKEAAIAVAHIKKVIVASRLLGINRMNTFIGRDWTKSVDDNWPRFLKTWKPLIKFAEDNGVKVGIENCPMYFSADEWPGGKNLAYCPAIWRRMFSDISSRNFGLNYDPSHMVWQRLDYIKPLREFKAKLFHVHAKDVRVDPERLADVGVLANPLEYHSPKLPGLGEVNWGRFFSVLSDQGYDGPVCIEVEDRAYEKTLARRQAALRQSGTFLLNYIS